MRGVCSGLRLAAGSADGVVRMYGREGREQRGKSAAPYWRDSVQSASFVHTAARGVCVCPLPPPLPAPRVHSGGEGATAEGSVVEFDGSCALDN